jgi:Tfp pilus assembly protein PilN
VRAVNLIPREQLAGAGAAAGRSGGGAYFVLALLAGLALLAVLYGHAKRDVSSRRAHVASLNARAQQVQASAAGLATYTSFIALREERERAVSELVDSRFDWAHAFHELGRVLPGKASITSIDGSVGSSTGSGTGSGGASSASGAKASATEAKASSATSATPPGSVPNITVNGCATSQAEVAITLNRLRLIDGVSEVTLQNSTKSTSSAAGGGQCPRSAPSFSAVITFAPLPPAGAAASASAVSASSTGGTR